MRVQMQKIGHSAATPPPQLPANTATSPQAAAVERPSSRTSNRPFVTTPVLAPEGTAGSPRRKPMRSRGNSYQGKAPPMSRTASNNTITQSRQLVPDSPGRLAARSSRGQLAPSPRQRQLALREISSRASKRRGSTNSSSSGDSSVDSSSEGQASRSQLGRSQIFRRAPRFSSIKQSKQKAVRDDDEDDEDDEPAFVAFSKAEERPNQDLGATLTSPPPRQEQTTRRPIEVTRIVSRDNTDSSASSIASSAAPIASPQGAVSAQRPIGPLSPRQKAQWAALNPRGRGKSGKKDASDGMPSMGSSFSDLEGGSGCHTERKGLADG